MSSDALAAYESTYRSIEWREPIAVEMAGRAGLACRVCIGLVGLKGSDTDRLFHTREEFDLHFQEHL